MKLDVFSVKLVILLDYAVNLIFVLEAFCEALIQAFDCVQRMIRLDALHALRVVSLHPQVAQ